MEATLHALGLAWHVRTVSSPRSGFRDTSLFPEMGALWQVKHDITGQLGAGGYQLVAEDTTASRSSLRMLNVYRKGKSRNVRIFRRHTR
jgi:hypothetical protein